MQVLNERQLPKGTISHTSHLLQPHIITELRLNIENTIKHTRMMSGIISYNIQTLQPRCELWSSKFTVIRNVMTHFRWRKVV